MSNTPSYKPRTPGQYLRLFFSGAAMGASDIVPGVSGGTMAFILDIYEELINAIKSVGPAAIKAGLQLKFKTVLEIVHWRFLLVLGAGVATAIVTLSGLLSWVLENEPEFLFAFFFGLVLASIIGVGARIENWRPVVLGALVGGAIAAYFVVGLVPAEASHDPLSLFLSGSVAIVAMILPGISGSFILLILGQYEYVLESVTEMRILDLSFVMAGCVVGIMLFSRLLSWLLDRYHETVIAALVGIMAGSLRKIWPWKEVLETVERHGEEFIIKERNILPDFASADFLIALGLLLLGFMLVSFIEHQKSRTNPVMLLVGRLMGRRVPADVVPAATSES